MSDKIEVGDTVECVVVCGDHGGITVVGVVLSTPSATGDAWRIRDIDDNLVYIQTYMMMTKRKP